VFLSKTEERILDGEKGTALAHAMKLLVTLGELGGAEKLVPIKRSQVAGVSYKTSGDATLELLESLVRSRPKIKSKTLATQNPAGMDLDRWREMGISQSFAECQQKICQAYERLGVRAYCTCTPYLSGNCPLFKEVVGFSESSAVAYVNSVIGARTNRHGGLDALSGALVGKVPLMGFLLDDNRKGNIEIKVCFKPRTEIDYAALGYHVGKMLRTNEVPVYRGLQSISKSQLKLMGAASAASGAVALYHVLGVTPEAKKEKDVYQDNKPSEVIEVGKREIRAVYNELSSSQNVDLIAIGCPHCSISEIREVMNLLKGKRIRRNLRFWIFTSPHVYSICEKKGYNKILRAAGADIFRHTCMVVMPIEEIGIKCVGVNSAKAAFYIPRSTNNKCHAVLKPLKEWSSVFEKA
jgi:predicted aconitase